MLVNDAHGRLGLGSEAHTLCYNGASVRKNRLFVAVHIALTFLLRIKQEVEFRIFVLEIQLKHFFAVIDLFALGIFHSESVIQSVLHIFRIVFRIGVFFIQNILDRGILCGVDAESAAVHQVLSLRFRISFNVHQIVDHLVDQLVFKIGINSAGRIRDFSLGSLDPGVYVVCKSFVILGLSDISLIQHMVQNLLPSFGVCLRMFDRIVLRRILGDPGQSRALGKIQIPYVFVEILSGRCLHAVGSGA